jgi:hypothetical protein
VLVDHRIRGTDISNGSRMQGMNPSAAQDHAWEECKENFKPVKDGRKAETLHKCSVGALKSVLHDKTLEHERRYVSLGGSQSAS